MGTGQYWSVEECRWVDCPGPATAEAEPAVPQQRVDEPALEPAEA